MLENRYDVVLVFDVTRGNPNGDPDAGNYPRVDGLTGLGVVSNHSLKRKMRDALKSIHGDDVSLYTRRGANLSKTQDEVVADMVRDGVAKNKKELTSNHQDALVSEMQRRFDDVRLFGAVVTCINRGITGPVQVTDAVSVDRIAPENMGITCVAGSGEKNGESRSQNMGNRWLVPYGLYVAHMDILQTACRGSADNQCSQEDVDRLLDAVTHMFDMHRTSTSGEQVLRRMIVFKHSTRLGDQPVHQLYDAVRIERKCEGLPTSYEDYDVTVDRSRVRDTVEVIEMV